MSYAVVLTGGRQYRVKPGDVLDIGRIPGDEGSTASLEHVLAHGEGEAVVVGSPKVEGAKVQAEILAHIRAPKVTAFKYKRRKGYHRKVGHRQEMTRIKVAEIIG